MNEQAEQLKDRTKKFALEIIKVCRALPREEEARIIGRQLLRAATSVGANYRATCRARSKAEFISKMGLVLEEADECAFWIEILIESSIVTKTMLAANLAEAVELVKIFAASLRTARAGR